MTKRVSKNYAVTLVFIHLSLGNFCASVVKLALYAGVPNAIIKLSCETNELDIGFCKIAESFETITHTLMNAHKQVSFWSFSELAATVACLEFIRDYPNFVASTLLQ